MKKPKKKYNAMKGALASAKIGLRNLAVFHSHRDRGEKYTCSIVNIKTVSSVTVSQSMAFAIGEIRHKWNVHLLAIGVDGSGKGYFKVDEVAISEPLLQSQLVDYLDWRHKDFVDKSFNKNHLTNVAWLAVPNGDSISNEQIDNILTKYEAY